MNPFVPFLALWALQEPASSCWVRMSDPLPPDWVACLDPETGHTYYQNSSTHVTQWERPDLLAAQAALPVAPVAMHVRTRNWNYDTCCCACPLCSSLQIVAGAVACVAGVITCFVGDWLVCIFALVVGLVVMAAGLTTCVLNTCVLNWKYRTTYGAYANYVAVLLCLAGIMTFAVVYERNRNRVVDVDWVHYVCCPADMIVPDCTEACTYNANPQDLASWNDAPRLCETSDGGRCTKQSRCNPMLCSSQHPSGFSHYINCWADPDDEQPGDRVPTCRSEVYGSDEVFTDFTPLQTGKKAQRQVETTSVMFSLVVPAPSLTSPPFPAC